MTRNDRFAVALVVLFAALLIGLLTLLSVACRDVDEQRCSTIANAGTETFEIYPPPGGDFGLGRDVPVVIEPGGWMDCYKSASGCDCVTTDCSQLCAAHPGFAEERHGCECHDDETSDEEEDWP